MVELDKKWLFSKKNGCIQVKVVDLWQSGYITAEVLLFWQKWLYSCKVIVIGQGCCIRAEMVVFV